MRDSCRVIGLIPARGGSKGIPGKNLIPLGGLPLIGHAIRNARAARRIEGVVVSTDSEEIARAARSFGAEVPFLRPPELALDETPMLPVVEHAFRELGRGAPPPSVIALLQPTSPFLRPETIDRAIADFEAGTALHLQAVTRVREHPAWMLARRGGRLEPYLEGPVPRRQDLPELFIPCGALYLYREEYLAAQRQRRECAWLEVDWPESLDIDEPRDLEIARWVLDRGLAGQRSER